MASLHIDGERPIRSAVAAIAFVAVCGASGASAQSDRLPATTLSELFDQLQRCLAPPSDTPAGEITIQLSLRRDGTMLGWPRVTYKRLPIDSAQRSAFEKTVANALDHCVPAAISDELGAAIAGRQIFVRFVVPPPRLRGDRLGPSD